MRSMRLKGEDESPWPMEEEVAGAKGRAREEPEREVMDMESSSSW
jgi:hypothetical protein